MLAAEGYPGDPAKGDVITRARRAELLGGERAVFHAGTARRDGDVVTSGGRVLTVAALGDDLRAAVANAYAAVGRHRASAACTIDTTSATARS